MIPRAGQLYRWSDGVLDLIIGIDGFRPPGVIVLRFDPRPPKRGISTITSQNIADWYSDSDATELVADVPREGRKK